MRHPVTNKRSFSCHEIDNISESEHENFEKSLRTTNLSESENENVFDESRTIEYAEYKRSLDNIENKISEMVGTPNPNKDNTIQTGMDRYGFVLVTNKRKGSPQATPAVKRVQNQELPLKTKNKFAPLKDVIAENDEKEEAVVIEKPPPIYLREKSSGALVDLLKKCIGANFFIVPMRRGAIEETKIQINDVPSYRKIIEELDTQAKNYYTYQLKSAKGLSVVIKGIESSCDPNDIKEDLENQGFKIKNIFNIFNKDKIPQPMFKVELMPSDRKLKKSEEHPIYKVRSILHRRVIVEEPLKRKSVVQCFKCQEFGHTKSYCKLQDVCVICGKFHETKLCPLDKKEIDCEKNRHCNNCQGNHTANYKGCPVYAHEYNRIFPKQRDEQSAMKKQLNKTVNLNENKRAAERERTNTGGSYAHVLKNGNTEFTQNDNLNEFQKISNMMLRFMESMEKNMNLMMQNMNTLVQLLLKNSDK